MKAVLTWRCLDPFQPCPSRRPWVYPMEVPFYETVSFLNKKNVLKLYSIFLNHLVWGCPILDWDDGNVFCTVQSVSHWPHVVNEHWKFATLRTWILILVNFNFNLNTHMGLVLMVLGSAGQHIAFLSHFTLLTALEFALWSLPDSPKCLQANE